MSAPVPAVNAGAAVARQLRRGLPRVPGGEPWPPAGEVSVSVAALSGAPAAAAPRRRRPPAAAAAPAELLLRKQCRQRRRLQLLRPPHRPRRRREPPRFVAGFPVSPVVNRGRPMDFAPGSCCRGPPRRCRHAAVAEAPAAAGCRDCGGPLLPRLKPAAVAELRHPAARTAVVPPAPAAAKAVAAEKPAKAKGRGKALRFADPGPVDQARRAPRGRRRGRRRRFLCSPRAV